MNRSRLSLAAALAMLLSLLSACAAPTNQMDDLLTQKGVEAGKIPITISTKYSVFLNEFERAAEEKFPNLELIQVGNHTANFSDEFAEQLANDDLTDIVLTWPLDSAARDCADRLIDLSGMEFTSRYRLSMLNGISQDGALYYLPGPTQVRGILFNKTMFEENGWAVPTNFEEFVDLCRTIEESGIRSLQLSFWNKEVLRNAFMGFGYGPSFSTPMAAQALQRYNGGEGSLRDFALPAFESFEALIDAGVFQPGDLSVRYPMREQMLFNRQCAMVSDGMDLIQKARQAGYSDEFAVMPFFCPASSLAWGHVTLTQYIGLNKHLTDPGNQEKYNMVLQLMDFISTPEGQLALANGNTSMVSSLSACPPPAAPELEQMKATIEAGRCVVFPTFERTEDALYNALAAMLKGEITRDEAIGRVDRENANPTPAVGSPVIGKAGETFSLAETGAYVTDVMRAAAGTDLALFLDNGRDGTFNARGISAKLYQGDILESDVTNRVLPVLQHGETGYLNIVTISGDNLVRALEYALDGGNWFYYCSGLRMAYDPSGPQGSRIRTLTDGQGKAIEPSKLYTVAILEGSVEERYLSSVETTDLLIKDLVIRDIKEKGAITPGRDGRLQFSS